jgi:outer membrane immunogenic protein
VGYAFSNILLYATIGLAVGSGQVEIVGSTEHKTHFGWAAGAGMEVGLTPSWSMRVEYLFVDLAARPYTVTGARNGFESGVLRLGINYRF